VYSGGGRPRGVVLDHANLLAASSGLIAHLRLTAADRSLLVLPLPQLSGIVLDVLSVLRAGGDTVIAHGCTEGEFWQQVEARRPTFFSASPPLYTLLDPRRSGARPDTTSLRFALCNTAPLSAELCRRFERRCGVPVLAGYGLAEGTAASLLNPVDGVRKPGTAGRPLPGQSVWVVDHAGRRVPPGRTGEVIISGPNVMRGYLGRPQESLEALRDGWLRTGDIGRFDEDGYLTIVGRRTRKDLPHGASRDLAIARRAI
jgi:long-chain acyl-CoA synthetase